MTPPHPARPVDVVIAMPVYNDWAAAQLLCQALDASLADLPQISARILLIDDGSPEGGSFPPEPPYSAITEVEVLTLSRNMGHQRAIAIGLAYIHARIPCDAVLVMDADGEDRPEDAVRLIRKFIDLSGSTIVFAERGKRREEWHIQALYHLYRVLHHAITGIRVRVGNFSIVPFHRLATLVTMSELWNHYAACVFKSKLPYLSIRANKGERLSGHSRMNLPALVAHGLAALATFNEIVATRLLLATCFLLGMLGIGLVVVVGIRLGTSLAIPGWATTAAGLLLVIMVQLAATFFGLIFSVLASRGNATFVPFRDYQLFTAGCTRILSRGRRKVAHE
jgi:polyisoprenyl-phosphate glycosyltransferase